LKPPRLLAPLALVACNALLGGPGSGPAGGDGGAAPGPGDDAGPVADDGGAAIDVVVADARPDALSDGPPDVACTEPWVKVGRTQPGCVARTTHTLDRGFLDTSTLSIARTATGRVGVAFNSKLSFDEGVLKIAHFTPATSSFTAQLTTIAGTQFEDIGPVARVGARGGDVLHLA